MHNSFLHLFGAVVALLIAGVSYSANPPMKKTAEPEASQDMAVENPYKDAKVGDWASYKLTTTTTSKFKVTGPEVTNSKTTVIAKTEKDVTTRTVVTSIVDGKESVVEEYETKIDLASAPADVKRWAGGKQDKEKITLGGKEYVSTKSKIEGKGRFYNSETRSEEIVWFSKSAPLSGLVKSVSKNFIGDTMMEQTLELTASGGK